MSKFHPSEVRALANPPRIDGRVEQRGGDKEARRRARLDKIVENIRSKLREAVESGTVGDLVFRLHINRGGIDGCRIRLGVKYEYLDPDFPAG